MNKRGNKKRKKKRKVMFLEERVLEKSTVAAFVYGARVADKYTHVHT